MLNFIQIAGGLFANQSKSLANPVQLRTFLSLMKPVLSPRQEPAKKDVLKNKKLIRAFRSTTMQLKTLKN